MAGCKCGTAPRAESSVIIRVMPKAIRVSATGGPEVLQFVDLPAPVPGRGEVLLRIEAIGVNFIDVYHRTGLYKVDLPFTPGAEAAGVVADVGEGVTRFARGQRVAWGGGMHGAYAEFAVVPESRLVAVPEGVDSRLAAAVTLQGMTAHYLATSTCPLQQGDTILVHAAAGGVGGLLIQIAKARGARVFGTVSIEEKAVIAREAGADEVILYTKTNFEEEVLRLTGGEGVRAVYDSVGRTTFLASLNCVALRGTLALYGQSSGPVPPFEPSLLAKKAIYLTRPALHHYTHDREELDARARDVFAWIAAGKLRVRIDRELPLHEAPAAHRALEGRETVGKVLLLP